MQFNVYLTPSDEQSLVEHLQQQCEILIHRSVYFSDDERLVSNLRFLGKYPTDQQVGLTSTQFLDSLVKNTFSVGHSRLDLIYSPVVEFQRCELKGDSLRPGRFWYQLDGNAGKKSDEFKKWAGGVFRQVKRKLIVKSASERNYIGRQAADLALVGKIVFSF